MDQVDANADRLIANDPPPLPGPATSWAKGEAAPTPVDDSAAPSGTGMSLDDLVKGPPKELQAGLTKLARDKTDAADKIYRNMASQTDEDHARLKEAYQKEGVQPGEFKKWNADEEAAKRRTDPIEAFASFGSVFGILASAFTNAPMENAMNASAAAMNAIHAGDDKAYDRAHKAWEENTKMALDRHQLEHQAFQDAATLMQHDMTAGINMAKINAARFDNKKEQFLLENGMIKEWYEYQEARQRAGLALAENLPKVTMANAEISRLFALGYDTKNPQSEKSQKALVQFQKERAELKHTERGFGVGAANLTTERQRAQDVASYRQQLRAEENQDGTPKYTAGEIAHKAAEFERGLKTEAAAITGNKKDELTGKIDRVDYMTGTIDKVEQLLAKHKAIAGIGGAVTRPAEAISNIFGSDATDRRQFERYVLELQEWAPQVLNDRNGRPLSAEAGKIMGIIAGLRIGDTTANTVRAYRELKPLLAKIKSNLGERRGTTPSSEQPTTDKPAAPWERDPVAK